MKKLVKESLHYKMYHGLDMITTSPQMYASKEHKYIVRASFVMAVLFFTMTMIMCVIMINVGLSVARDVSDAKKSFISVANKTENVLGDLDYTAQNTATIFSEFLRKLLYDVELIWTYCQKEN